MRPSLSDLVRSVLLREAADPEANLAAQRPPDPAEGEIGEEAGLETDPDKTDNFLLTRETDRVVSLADRRADKIVPYLSDKERGLFLRDKEEMGGGRALLSYVERLAARPLTDSEMFLFTDSEGSSGLPYTEMGRELKSLYQRLVSWCFLSERFVGMLSDALHKIGVRRVVEVGAGRGALARIMRSQGFSWRAFDASSVASAGIVRSSGARVLASLRPGSCDAIAVSWAHFKDDWDSAILDASERLGVPVVTITAQPDVSAFGSGLTVNGVSRSSVSFTHSLPFWRRVEAEFAVSVLDSSGLGESESGRRDVALILTPRKLDIHPLPESGYHTSSAQEMVHYIFERIVGWRPSDAFSDEQVEKLIAFIASGGRRDEEDKIKDDSLESAAHLILSLNVVQGQEAAARGGLRMPEAHEWAEDFIRKCASSRTSTGRLRPPPRLLERPMGGSWFSFEV
jgi:hypothetical protein